MVPDIDCWRRHIASDSGCAGMTIQLSAVPEMSDWPNAYGFEKYCLPEWLEGLQSKHAPAVVEAVLALLTLLCQQATGLGFEALRHLLVRLERFGQDSTLRDRLSSIVANAVACRDSAWACSAAKIRSETGFQPAMSLESRLRQTADWYRQQKWL